MYTNATQKGRTEVREATIAEGIVDVGRKLYPDADDYFSWWAPWRNPVNATSAGASITCWPVNR